MAGSNRKQQSLGKEQVAALWTHNPYADRFVGCGAWSAPLLLVAYFSGISHPFIWSSAFYALRLFLNYPHYLATVERAHSHSREFKKYVTFFAQLILLLVLTMAVSRFWPRAWPGIFTIFLTWSPWHYSQQNFDIFLKFLRRSTEPTNGERRSAYAAFLISCALLFLNFHTGNSADPVFVSLNIPPAISWKLQLGLGLGFAGCSSYMLTRLLDRVDFRRMLPSLTVFSTQLVWFLLPTVLSHRQGLRILPSYYSTGILAVMHAAQYLWLASGQALSEANSGNRSWRPYAYFAGLVLGGIALFTPVPWIASHAFHADYARSLLFFTTLVNFHHFLLDAAARNPEKSGLAKWLVRSSTSMSEAASEAGTQAAAAARWVTGPTPAARALRIGSAVVLLLWGTVDQVRYYLALRDDNVANLRRAVALDAYDTPLEMKLARKELEAGKPEAALAAWKKAQQADPADPGPRNAMLEYLTSQKRYDEAYELTRTALERSPRDAELMLNHGLLAMQMGNTEEALKSWQHAMATDPALADAHLYVAQELDNEGKSADAVPQYAAYLEMVANQRVDARPQAAKLIGTTLKLAECQMRAEQPDQALRSYELARKIAAHTGEGKLESFASVGEAGLQAKSGKTDEALHLYQHALQLDASLRDRHNEGLDWYNYAVFLRAAGFPARLAYASLLKSKSLMQIVPDGADAKLFETTMQDLEKSVGAEAAAIRRHPEPIQQQALALSRSSSKVRIDF